MYVWASDTNPATTTRIYIYVYKQIEVQLLTVTTNDPTTLFNKIDEYLIYRLNQLKQEFSNQTYSIKCRILRNHRYSLPMKVYINVSPEPYLDPMNNSFNSLQWHQLCPIVSYLKLEFKFQISKYKLLLPCTHVRLHPQIWE